MNTFLATCTFFIATMFGIYYSQRFYNRYKFYLAIEKFNKDFITVINFSKDNLCEMLKKDYNFEPFNNLLKMKGENLISNRLTLPSFLKDDEKQEIFTYFMGIGKFDCSTQKQVLTQYENLFSARRAECESDNKKYGVLYKKIGIIVGLIAFVIVV